MGKREEQQTRPVYGPERPPEQNNFHGLTPEFFHQIWLPQIQRIVQSEGGIEGWLDKNPHFREMASMYIRTDGQQAARWVKENCPVDKSEGEILTSMKRLLNPSTPEAQETEVNLSAETAADQSDI